MIRAVDLFAGAGGFSTGARMAGVDVVWAANHWRDAVDCHQANHPGTQHACQDLHQVDWGSVPTHDILLASPACQGHSLARGKDAPRHDASRSTAWAVVSCAEVHSPQAIVIENVPEFRRWILFPSWIDALHRLGYSMTQMVMDSADHGVPQHRRRLFVIGVRGRTPVSLAFAPLAHVGAETIIEESSAWSPISARCARTLDRIRHGRCQHGSRFLIAYYGSSRGGRSTLRPIGTITTRDRYALVDGDRMRMLTVSELRAAMGFPASYVLPARRALAKHLLGNAVVPRVACDLIRHLLTVL